MELYIPLAKILTKLRILLCYHGVFSLQVLTLKQAKHCHCTYDDKRFHLS